MGLVLVLVARLVLGIAWTPGGNAPGRVIHGTACPEGGPYVSVLGPDLSDEQDPTTNWSLVDGDPDSLPWGGFGGYGAEAYVKAQLPWRVRFRINWDSEGGALVAVGSRYDVCMVARVVDHIRNGR